jgi:hypothetical protein
MCSNSGTLDSPYVDNDIPFAFDADVGLLGKEHNQQPSKQTGQFHGSALALMVADMGMLCKCP